MSLRTEFPTMQKRSGATPSWRRIRAYVSGSFSSTTSTTSKWWAIPDISTLRVWWTRSPFVISTRRWSRARSASTAGTSGSSRTSSVSIASPRSTSWPSTAAGARPSVTLIAAFTIASVNDFDAVAGDRQVRPLGRPQRGGDVDARRHVRRDELDEALLDAGERVLAVPQRVVGVERDDVEPRRGHWRSLRLARRVRRQLERGGTSDRNTATIVRSLEDSLAHVRWIAFR